VNPPAEVSTSLKVYQGHTLEKTYMGEDFFWAITPMAGDYVLFKFDRPVNIERSVCLRLREIHTHLQGWVVMMAWWPDDLGMVWEVQARLKSSAAFIRIALIHHSHTHPNDFFCNPHLLLKVMFTERHQSHVFMSHCPHRGGEVANEKLLK